MVVLFLGWFGVFFLRGRGGLRGRLCLHLGLRIGGWRWFFLSRSGFRRVRRRSGGLFLWLGLRGGSFSFGLSTALWL